MQSPWLVLTAYLLGENLVSFAMFWWDKRSARLGRRRISEYHLLMAAAVGGTLGAKAGQRRFRHKTYKQPFRTYLNVIAGLQISLLCLLAWMAVQAPPAGAGPQ